MKKIIIVFVILILLLVSILCLKWVIIFFPSLGNSSLEEQPLSENIVNNVVPSNETTLNEPSSSNSAFNVFEMVLPPEEETVPDYDFYFELPINGSTGYASISMNIFVSPDAKNVIKRINAGTAFLILEEHDKWWKIQINNTTGWVDSTYCMINLPDVIPSIIYDDTNSYSSLFKSSGFNIENITGEKLYDVYCQNNRLSKKQYMMPIIYSAAKKIMTAQKMALEDGYSLQIYETYRPYETQRKVCTNLKKLIEENQTVYDGIFANGWSEDWFINQSISNHQRGIAMDVSLVKIKKSEISSIGKYKFHSITKYQTLKMPSPIHELSDAAVTFTTRSSFLFKNSLGKGYFGSYYDNKCQEATKILYISGAYSSCFRMVAF